MRFDAFSAKFALSSREIARQVYLDNRDALSVKKEKTAVRNLEKILDAVFAIAYEKGFQAMGMRDLSRATGMSLGSLYAYFPGKEELLAIIQTQGWRMLRRDLDLAVRDIPHPWDKLKAVIRAHLFLSELFRPLFYFTFMEARNIHPAGVEAVKSMEAYTQRILIDILDAGEQQGLFKPGNHDLTASMIKAMQQEWYLKRWKYRKMNVGVDRFADHVIGMTGAFCLAGDSRGNGGAEDADN